MQWTPMLRPAGSVCLYLPNRSTLPARSCGTMRTVFASTTTTKTRSRASRTKQNSIGPPFRLGLGGKSGVETRDRVDQRGGAADLQHLHGLAGRDGGGLVVGRRAPDLAVQPDAADREAGDLLGH